MRPLVCFLLTIVCLSLAMSSPLRADDGVKGGKELVREYKEAFPDIDIAVIKYAVEHDMKPDILNELLVEVEKEGFEVFEDYDIRIAYNQHEECAVSSASNFYHCPCTAVNYVEFMRQSGGGTLGMGFLDLAEKQCPFVESVANLSYIECKKGMKIAYRGAGFDEDKYCECFANRYARQFEEYPSTARADRFQMRKAAYSYCAENYRSFYINDL